MKDLKELIAEKQLEGISQKDIANSTGVNQTYISQLKNGNGSITQENYDRIKEYFGEDFAVGGGVPVFVQSSRKPKPLKISQEYHDAAMELVLNGLDLNGKAIVPNCYRGHEDVLISKLARMDIKAKYIPNENGGIIEEIKAKSTFDPTEALKVNEVEQTKCEVMEYVEEEHRKDDGWAKLNSDIEYAVNDYCSKNEPVPTVTVEVDSIPLSMMKDAMDKSFKKFEEAIINGEPNGLDPIGLLGDDKTNKAIRAAADFILMKRTYAANQKLHELEEQIRQMKDQAKEDPEQFILDNTSEVDHGEV